MSKDKTSTSFELETFHRNVSDDDLISDLVKISQEIGKKNITFRDYNKKGKYRAETIALRLGSWNNALEKAGLEKSMNKNSSNELLFKNLAELWTKLGKQPKTRDLSKDQSTYSWSTYASRFGGWRNALQEFVKWANDENVPMAPNDLLDLKSRKTPRSVNLRLRWKVLNRDNFTCKNCGASPPKAKLQVDHIHPWSKGGETTIDNLQTLCIKCNGGKSNLVT